MITKNDENWAECLKCGAPVLINPESDQPEPCSQCASKTSPWGLYTGSVALAIGLMAVILVVFLCLRLFYWLTAGPADAGLSADRLAWLPDADREVFLKPAGVATLPSGQDTRAIEAVGEGSIRSRRSPP